MKDFGLDSTIIFAVCVCDRGVPREVLAKLPSGMGVACIGLIFVGGEFPPP